ncbi:MAG: Holliday junction branch migration protein RuvA [Candidatus Magasanikbacteria bacterium]
MIANVVGKIVANNGAEIVVQTVGGVGYEIKVSTNGAQSFKVGQEAQILTCLSVRENSMELFGFANQEEKNLFGKLISVSGIGPKSALHILSLGSVQDISAAINRGDVSYLKKVSGIGGKTAERIVVDLKGKMDNVVVESKDNIMMQNGESTAVSDAIEGLIALGYSAVDAREVIKQLEVEEKASEQILKEALRRMR